MHLIKPSVEIITPINAGEMLKRIERAGRTCYRSEDKITDDSAYKFIKARIATRHHSILEHESISVKFVCQRSVSHELVRHRIASYSQESQRYVGYDKKGVQFIIPPWITDIAEGEYTWSTINNLDVSLTTKIWIKSLLMTEENYNLLREMGWKPEEARDILPNACRTEIVATMNIRSWMHFFEERTAKAAYMPMRIMATELYDKFNAAGLGVFFEGIQPYRK